MEQTAVVAGLKTERERLDSFVRGLTPEQWQAPSLCAGWSIRDVIAHLAGNATDVTAMNLADAGSEAYNQRQLDERAGRTTDELLAEWREKGALFEQITGDMPPEAWAAPIPDFHSIGHGVQRLLEDVWVHACDIRIPLGFEPEIGPGLPATLEVMAFELPGRLERLCPAVKSVAFSIGDFNESVTRDAGTEDVEISGDPVTLALVGTGRVALDDATADGRLKVAPRTPSGLGDALNIYGP